MTITAFTYNHSDSVLHRLDVRCKLFALSCLSISILKAEFLALLIIISLSFYLIIHGKIKPGALFSDLKYFFILLFLVFTARAVTTAGEPLLVFLKIVVTKQGITEGALICLRFFSIMLMGIIFACTTKPSSVKNGVEWFLKPVPFIPEKRVSVMITLFLRFMPLILKQADEISDAQKARCGDLQKNPLKRIINISVPLLKKTFLSADRLAMAMESRSYSEDRTDPEFTKSGKEKKFYFATFALSAISFIL
ncbi:MAG: energy-coupling factor transporter transmembrane component T [Thermodesulfobacteriota bacterium]|nr:energy-coupling factor transporter transmembrane component T [Thermodesulfobacteriota bacterium]